MIQFNINNRMLDLYNNTSLQLVRTNMIFALDKVEMSRTVQFKVPATPNNNAIFDLCNSIETVGNKARQKISAQAYYSGGVLNGQLYILSATKQDYTVIFLFGGLQKLKEIVEEDKKIGNIQENWLQNSWTLGSIDWYLDNRLFSALPYDNGYLRSAASEFYYAEGAFPLPSYNLKELLYFSLRDTYEILLNTLKFPDFDKLRATIAQPKNKYGEDATKGDSVSLGDNMIEFTIWEFMKVCAVLAGALVRFELDNSNPQDERYIFNFINYSSFLSNFLTVKDLISEGEIYRNFLDYGQSSVVKMGDDSEVQLYTINNKNIDDKYTINEVPFRLADGSSNYGAVIKDLQVVGYNTTNVTYKFLQEIGTLFLEGTDIFHIGKRYSIPKNDILVQLCKESTSTKIKMKMSLYEFLQLDELQRVLYKNLSWVWTSARWQDDAVELSLSKLS